MRAARNAVLAGLACRPAPAKQANVNLDYDVQENTGNLVVPFQEGADGAWSLTLGPLR